MDGQHLVALVRVPATAVGDPRKARDRGQDQHRHEGEPLTGARPIWGGVVGHVSSATGVIVAGAAAVHARSAIGTGAWAPASARVGPGPRVGPGAWASASARGPRRRLLRRRAPSFCAARREGGSRQRVERTSLNKGRHPRHVDRVPALLHPRCLEVVGDMPEPWVGDHPGQPRPADPAGPDVLVAVRARPERRARVIEVDHPEALKTQLAVDAGDHVVHARERVDRVAGAPRVCRVEAEGEPVPRHARGYGRGVDRGELLHRRAHAETTAWSVLEYQDHVGGVICSRAQHRCHGCCQTFDSGVDPGATVRADVDVDECRPVRLRDAELVGQHLHRALDELVARAGQVDKVRRVDREGDDVVRVEAVPECRQLPRKCGPATPRRGIVGEHLQRGRADLDGTVGCPDHAATQREVGAEAPSVREHRRKRSPARGLHGPTTGRVSGRPRADHGPTTGVGLPA